MCFGLLFGAAELYQWASQAHWLSSDGLSLPILIIGGLGLAIASNYRHLPGLTQRHTQLITPRPTPSPLPSPPETTPTRTVPPPSQRSTRPSISFEIRKSNPHP